MARWQLEPKPKAILIPVDPQPIANGDGGTTQRWRTENGKIHVQRVLPGGGVEWYLQTEG